MNAKLKVATVTALVLAAGCSQERMDPSNLAGQGEALTLRLESAADTRVDINGGGSFGKVSWVEGDIVALHMSDGKYTTEPVKPGTDPTTGTVISSTITGLVRDYYAVYPSSVMVDTDYGNPTLVVKLPATYDISSQVSKNASTVPMVAKNDPETTSLHFYQVGGMLRITCDAVPAGTSTIVVEFSKNVTGKFSVSNLTSLSASAPAPSITPASASGDNTQSVTFTIAGASGLSAATDGIVLNVPLPCDDYAGVTVRGMNGSTEKFTRTRTETIRIPRAHGKKLHLN